MSFTTPTPAPHSSRRKLIGLCQLTSHADPEENYAKVAAMVRRAHAEHPHCRMVFLPEYFDYVAPPGAPAPTFDPDGEYIGKYRALARETGMWLSLGGFHECRGPGLLPFNTHLVINEHGESVACYRKLHLFDLVIPSRGMRVMESERNHPGECLVPPCSTPIGSLGLATCHDVRFAELALWNRSLGAEVLAYGSCFSVPTGIAHWETLLKARAIEVGLPPY